MGKSTFKLQPGVVEVETPALNTAGISTCQLIRFKPDSHGQGALTEKLGGWAKFYAAPLPSIGRAIQPWQDTNSNKWVAVGMSTMPSTSKAPLAVMACTQGTNGITTAQNLSDITPTYESSSGTATFSVTVGSPIIDITDTAVGAVVVGSAVYITTPVAVGGLILFGMYAVYAQTGLNSYQIIALNALGQPAPALSTAATTLPSLTTVANSNTVTVVLANHGYSVGSTFTALNSTTIGGIVFYGNYIVSSVIDANTFTFLAPNSATSSATATLNGGNVSILYAFSLTPPQTALGYGLGGYGLGGYGIGQTVPVPPSTYSPASDWTLDNWGEDLIACPIGGQIGGIPFSPICYWSPTSGQPIAVAIPQAPTVSEGAFVAMPQRQIIAWGTTFTGVKDPLLVRWCDVSNFNSWLGNITNQAGSYRLPRGSRIVGGLQGPQQGLLWTDLALWSMQYINQPYIYSFNEVGTGCGLIARKAAVSMNGVTYWMGRSQFFKFDGSGVTPIDCPVWDVAYQDLDLANLNHIRAAANSQFNEVTWYFPVAGGNGEATNYVKFNVLLNTWDFGTLDRSAWADQSVVGPPIAVSPSLNFVYQHEISPDADGAPLMASFTSGMFTMADGEYKTFVDEIWPDMKWGYYGKQQNANLSLTFLARDFPGQQPIIYGPFALTAELTYLSPRIRGRLLQIQLQSNDVGSWWRIGGMRYRGAPDGKY